MAECEIVEGTIKSVVFHNDANGYTVLHVERPSEFELARNPEITIVGKAQAVWEGEDVRAEGRWVTDPVHGRQFKADKLTCVAPRSLKGIEKYLASGLIKGIGPVLAHRIVETFGEETMHVLQYQSGRLREVPKLGNAKIAQIRESWHQNETMRENMIFGQTYGISITKMTKIVKKYGPDAIAIVKADPYRLCRDIWGIGFTTADKIALSVGIPKDSPLRARASISYTLETESEEAGHCWTLENDLLLHANELTGIPTEIIGQALETEVSEGRVVAEAVRAAREPYRRNDAGADSDGRAGARPSAVSLRSAVRTPDSGDGGKGDPSWSERHDVVAPRRIYLKSLYYSERDVASRVRTILASPRAFPSFDASRAMAWWESRQGFTLAERQREALLKSLSSKFSIITGGPGVGKTTIIRALVEIYGKVKKRGEGRGEGEGRGGDRGVKVVLAAPTGRAAKRMSESVGAEAQTIHRLLKWNPVTNKFTFDEENRLEGDVFIFDETSMIDIRLACDLFKALPDNAVVVWVGDTDQLPSVGPGSVLRDLIRSNVVPSTRLDFIFRQDTAGLIVKNAHHVNAGEPLEVRRDDNTDFYFARCEDPQTCLARTIEFMTDRIPRKFGMDPLRDVQVLTPMRRNVLGTDNLNVELQKALNPHGDAIIRGGTTFRVGDRVMQLRNNYEKDVYNGDVGFIRAINGDDRSLVVDYDGRPVKYDAGDLDEIVLAYAMTIHKSQGSEYPAVIVLMHTQHYVMLQRNLLYTAITRGRKLVLLMGVPYAIDKAIKTNTVRERRTSLVDFLTRNARDAAYSTCGVRTAERSETAEGRAPALPSGSGVRGAPALPSAGRRIQRRGNDET